MEAKVRLCTTTRLPTDVKNFLAKNVIVKCELSEDFAFVYKCHVGAALPENIESEILLDDVYCGPKDTNVKFVQLCCKVSIFSRIHQRLFNL